MKIVTYQPYRASMEIVWMGREYWETCDDCGATSHYLINIVELEADHEYDGTGTSPLYWRQDSTCNEVCFWCARDWLASKGFPIDEVVA